MYIQKKKLNLEILSKICISPAVSLIDPCHLFSILGYRQSLFSLINPKYFKYLLKTSFLAIESFLKNKYTFVFITNISDSTLFNKFQQICRKKNYFLLKDSETFAGFLTNKKKSKIVLITLFLDYRKVDLIQKESLLMHIPLISFSDLSANKLSSSIFISGNYNSFLVQNLILSLLSVCLQQKYD